MDILKWNNFERYLITPSSRCGVYIYKDWCCVDSLFFINQVTKLFVWWCFFKWSVLSIISLKKMCVCCTVIRSKQLSRHLISYVGYISDICPVKSIKYIGSSISYWKWYRGLRVDGIELDHIQTSANIEMWCRASLLLLNNVIEVC